MSSFVVNLIDTKREVIDSCYLRLVVHIGNKMIQKTALIKALFPAISRQVVFAGHRSDLQVTVLTTLKQL